MASGSPKPAVTLSASLGSLSFPCGAAFDGSGNLWVANENNSTLVAYTPSQLSASGSPTPAVTLTMARQPAALAFDSTGNLWVIEISYGINEFSPAQLAVSGTTPTPVVQLTGNGTSTGNPVALAFDNSGDLWVADYAFGKVAHSGTVVEYTANQLAASGAPTPTVTLGGTSLGNPTALAFDPHALNLPLRP
jgi:secreted PhoX family phosphatase